VATAALDLGQPERARDLYTEALTLRRQALPAGHPDIAMNLSGLAEACRALGQPGRVKALHEEALTLYRRALPDSDPLIAQSLNNLAAAHHDLGQHDRARDLYEEALALRKQARPADPSAVAGSLNNLAHTYRILGQPGKARVLHDEALALWRKTLPAGHPYIGAGLSNLAADYLALGQPEKARTLFEEALAVARTALPAGHPLIAGGLQNLALAELDLGLRDAAWRHARESAVIRTDHLLRVLAGSPQRDHLPLLAATPGPDLLFFLAERDRPSPKRLRELLGQVAARQSLAGLTAQLRHEAALVGADAAAAKFHASLKKARQRLADLLLRGAAPKDPAGFRNQCDEVRREQDRLDGRWPSGCRGTPRWPRSPGPTRPASPPPWPRGKSSSRSAPLTCGRGDAMRPCCCGGSAAGGRRCAWCRWGRWGPSTPPCAPGGPPCKRAKCRPRPTRRSAPNCGGRSPGRCPRGRPDW
jgi:tetratricopeptide (TPR) repeat protein